MPAARSQSVLSRLFRAAIWCLAVLPGITNLAGAAELPAGELPAADRPIEEVIDHFIEARLLQQNLNSAKPAGDLTFVRRVTLDLAGRIPTTAEARSYVESSDADKKVKLIDRLLASPDYAFHQRNVLGALLMRAYRPTNEWRQYLLEAARQNRPWDVLFREMMLGREDDPEHKTALTFLKVRADDVDDMTKDASRIFFGVAIDCAKCHDHPLVADWLQDHYYGFSSFFSRTYLTKKGTLAEKHSGQVKFKTVDGEERQAKFMFLTGAVVAEPQVEQTKEQLKQEAEEVKRQMKDEKAPPPTPPEFSPRREFVKLAFAESNTPYFARSIVNRIWARLLGRGLVHPLDQMHSGNPASHPDLLNWLSRDMMSHGYDLKRLIRGVVLSRTYARSSRWEGSGDAPFVDNYAVAQVRPLSPEQYSLSLRIAASNPDGFTGGTSSPEWADRRQSLEKSARGFAGLIERPSEHFLVSVDEALLLSNSDRVANDFLGSGGDRLIGKLRTISDPDQLIETACWAVNSRPPEPAEVSALKAYLAARGERREDALKQIVWAMLTGPELRFNY